MRGVLGVLLFGPSLLTLCCAQVTIPGEDRCLTSCWDQFRREHDPDCDSDDVECVCNNYDHLIFDFIACCVVEDDCYSVGPNAKMRIPCGTITTTVSCPTTSATSLPTTIAGPESPPLSSRTTDSTESSTTDPQSRTKPESPRKTDDSGVTDGSAPEDGVGNGDPGADTNSIELAVGLGVGIPLALAAVGYIAFLFWRTRRQSKERLSDKELSRGRYGNHTLSLTGQTAPYELSGRQMKYGRKFNARFGRHELSAGTPRKIYELPA